MLRFIALSCLSCTLIAQGSQGPLVGVPVHHIVGANTLGPAGVPLSTNELFLKRAGFVNLVPAVPFGPTRPRFTMDDMFGTGRPPGFRLDALSSGLCTVFCSWDAAGDPVLTIPAGAWGGLMFSVTRNSPGTGTGAVAAEALGPEGAGGDVFSLVLPGSTLPSGLACVPIGVAQRANDSSEMGLQFSAASKPEMGDFDPFFSFYEVQGPLPAFLPPSPWVYFSLPTAVAPTVPTWFNTRNGAPVPPPGNAPSGATILRTQWLATASPPAWTTPEVYLTYQELGLLASDDIDALSVQETGFPLPNGNPGAGVLVSLRNPPPPTPADINKQLMVAGFRWSGATLITVPARTYFYDDGTDMKEPVAKIAGAGGGGDIDASCEIDPSNPNGVGRVFFPYVLACRDDLGYPTTMHAAAFATRPASPGLMTVAVPVSELPSTPHFLLLGLGLLPAGTPLPTLNYVITSVEVPTSTTHTFSWSVSTTPGGYTAVLGLELEFQAIAIDLAFNISLARVVRLRV
jgi:hypothetical protein